MCLLAFFFVTWNKGNASSTFSYADSVDFPLAEGAILLDVRPQEFCGKQNLPGARCIPVSDFFGPHGRLVNFPDLKWLLGTVGLSGSENVVVAGTSPVERDFVAGILFLAGQQKVTILANPIQKEIDKTKNQTPGLIRNKTRLAVHHTPIRDELIILRNEMATLLKGKTPQDLLDGRSENEYWGEIIRSARGGHLPGAQHLPATKLRAMLKHDSAHFQEYATPIVYAHNPMESLAYFTLLRAGFGIGARVYIAGWRDWAMHTSLAADSVSYPYKEASSTKTAHTAAIERNNALLVAAVLILAGIVLMAGGYYWGRRGRS